MAVPDADWELLAAAALLVLVEPEEFEAAADVEDDEALPHAPRTVVPARPAIAAAHLVVNQLREEIRNCCSGAAGPTKARVPAEGLRITSREL